MIFLTARAKINWTLDITGRREDGYHLMDMLMQSVELGDTLWLDKGDSITLEAAGDENDALALAMCNDTMNAQAMRYDDSNLIIKAAKALRERSHVKAGARIRLLKRIPSGAGMGGGSADAAATLIGLNRLWGLDLLFGELCEMGLALGADVPFMLTGGLARVSGIGEVIKPLRPAPRIWLVVVQPCDGLSTRDIFAAYDALDEAPRPKTDEAQSALLRGDLRALSSAMGNVLEPVSVSRRAAIGCAARELEGLGAVRAMMTGSGSAVYGVFEREEQAEAAWRSIRKKYPKCALTRTSGIGVSVEGE